MRLVFRVDATPATGLGHAVRLAGIAAEIPTPLEMIVVGTGDSLADLFPGATIRAPDARPFRALAAAHNAAGILVDLPTYKAEDWSGDGHTPPVVAIDDFGGGVKADLIINGTVLDAYHRYPEAAQPERILAGARYALIRPVFARTPWRGDGAAGMAIVVGSGARARAWADIVTGEEVDRSEWAPVTMIVGQAFERIDEMRQRCERIGARLKVGVPAEVLADVLAGSRLALITGGMIVYEAAAAGVPAVVMPQMENMRAEVKWFAAQGCIHDLGFDAGMNPAIISSAVARLLRDRQLANDMSDRSRQTIDGQGMKRAAAAITALIQTPARPGKPA